MAVRCDGEKIAKRGRYERVELLLGEDFEEGGFLVVNASLEGGHEFHFDW